MIEGKSTSCELFIATCTQPDNEKEAELLSKSHLKEDSFFYLVWMPFFESSF